MAIEIAFFFQSPDRTDYLNRRLAGLIGKGLYDGATLTPTGAGLTATRSPFFAVGRDGLTIWDTEVGTFTYVTAQTNYHVILAKYNPLGSPSTPVTQELILSEAEYNAHPDKAYLIVVAKVTPAGAVLLSSEIDYSDRDEVGPFERSQLRGVVNTTAELPTGTPTFNREGDLYVVKTEPAPGGFGLYTWESGTGWRLIAALGAATLDGAYDNNAGGGPPGAGRIINVDSEAVELLQDNASQRQNDVANAALRIRKDSSVVGGDVGFDVVFSENDIDVGGLIIRNQFVSGTNMQLDEPVSVSGSTVTGTRVGPAPNWTHSNIAHANVNLVELTGSSLGNDGLYVAKPNGAATCQIKSLDGSTPALAGESGLTANFFSVRFATGAGGGGNLAEYDLSTTNPPGFIKFFGNVTASRGEVVYFNPSMAGNVFELRETQAGASSNLLASWTNKGTLNVAPSSTTTIGIHSTVTGTSAAILGETSGVGGVGLRSQMTNPADTTGYGIYGSHAGNGIAILGEALGTGSCQGVKGETSGSNAIGVFGNHLVGNDGWGVVGHSNHSNANYGSVDGFNFGSGPGVKGESVFGTGVKGIAGLLSVLPGVTGVSILGYGVSGTSTINAGVRGDSNSAQGVWGVSVSGAGVRGESTSGIGVLGSDFEFTVNKSFFSKWTLSAFEPEGGDASWLFADFLPNSWTTQANDAGKLLLSTADFQEGMKLITVYIPVYIAGGASFDVTVNRVRWPISGLGSPTYPPVEAAMGTSGVVGPGGGETTITVNCTSNNQLTHGNTASGFSDYVEVLINHAGPGTGGSICYVRGAFFLAQIKGVNKYFGTAVP